LIGEGVVCVVVGVIGNRAVGDEASAVELECLITAVGNALSAVDLGCCITDALRAVLELVWTG
jgi:hypothetical protein